MTDLELIQIAQKASLEAGAAILEIYDADDRGIEFKDDDSPLTQADKNAHDIIMRHLEETGIPVLSEEGLEIPYEERKDWKKFWMVDPLDGTKEFIKRNGDFTVNIALIENGSAVLGVVYIPVTEELYWGSSKGQKAGYQKGKEKEVALLQKSSRKVIWEISKGPVVSNNVSDSETVRILCSRSHMNDETVTFMNKFSKAEKIAKGSSLKFLKIAHGEADVYPRFGPTMEWDTAAAHAILSACGYAIKNADNFKDLCYNKVDLHNPDFVAF